MLRTFPFVRAGRELRSRCAAAVVTLGLAAIACAPTGDLEASRAAIAQGLEALQRGNAAAALASFEEAVTLDPGHAEAHSVYGAALEKSNRVAEARVQFAHAARLDPHSPDSRLHLARADWTLALDARIDAARQRVARDPNSVEAHLAIADLWLLRQRPAQARPHYERALRLVPELAAAHAGLGIAFGGQGAEPSALHHLARALEFDPQQDRARDELAWILATSKDESLLDVAAALEQTRPDPAAPSRPRQLDARAAAFARNGQWDEAVSTARAALGVALGNELLLHAAGARARLDRYARRQAYIAGH